MKDKLREKILREKRAETNRYWYEAIRGEIWRKRKDTPGAEWERVGKIGGE